MRKIIILSFLAILSFSTCAQNKFGYIDSGELLALMPEKKTAEDELQTFAKSLESQLGAMQAEYQQSVQDFQNNESTYTDLVKQDKIAEIQGLEQRIQSFQQNAQNALQKKEQELYKFILHQFLGLMVKHFNQFVCIENFCTYCNLCKLHRMLIRMR